jgi:hypothetical protein
MLLQLMAHQINPYLFSYTNKVSAAAAAPELLVMRAVPPAAAVAQSVLGAAVVVLAAAEGVYLQAATVQGLMARVGLAAAAAQVGVLHLPQERREVLLAVVAVAIPPVVLGVAVLLFFTTPKDINHEIRMD